MDIALAHAHPLSFFRVKELDQGAGGSSALHLIGSDQPDIVNSRHLPGLGIW